MLKSTMTGDYLGWFGFSQENYKALKVYNKNKEIEKTFEIKIVVFTLMKNFLGKDFPQRKRNELKLHRDYKNNPRSQKSQEYY